VIFVDTNVLIDVTTEDPTWFEWSRQELNGAAARDELSINVVVYAELSIRYDTIDQVDRPWGNSRADTAGRPVFCRQGVSALPFRRRGKDRRVARFLCRGSCRS
jgi:hypothetical protein